jgi:hypothetical protein
LGVGVRDEQAPVEFAEGLDLLSVSEEWSLESLGGDVERVDRDGAGVRAGIPETGVQVPLEARERVDRLAPSGGLFSGLWVDPPLRLGARREKQRRYEHRQEAGSRKPWRAPLGAHCPQSG